MSCQEYLPLKCSRAKRIALKISLPWRDCPWVTSEKKGAVKKKKQLSLMLVFALLAGFIGGALSSHIIQPVFAENTPKPHEKTIRSGGFEMVDEKGKMYAQLKLSERGSQLKIYGLKGGVVDLFINQPGRKPRVGLYLINQGASIKLTAEGTASYIRVYPDLSNRL